MCLAKQYIEELHNIHKRIRETQNILNERLSTLDKAEQDILHSIEMGGFNASEGYKLAKAIQDIRNSRRIVKNEYETLKELKTNIPVGLQEINNASNKIIKLEQKHENYSYKKRVLHNGLMDVTEILKQCKVM